MKIKDKYILQKRPTRKFCTFSILNRLKLIVFRSNYDTFCFLSLYYKLNKKIRKKILYIFIVESFQDSSLTADPFRVQ